MTITIIIIIINNKPLGMMNWSCDETNRNNVLLLLRFKQVFQVLMPKGTTPETHEITH